MKNKENSIIKTDCFAYRCEDGKEKCNALNRLYCKEGKCSFYKTKKENCEGCKKGPGRSVSCEVCSLIHDRKQNNYKDNFFYYSLNGELL